MKKALIVAALFAVMAGCTGRSQKDFLGAANAEMKVYRIAATVQGSVLSMLKEEGEAVEKDEVIAVVDTVPVGLSLKEIRAGADQVDRQYEAKQAEIEALKSDVAAMKRERDRTQGLLAKGSATVQSLDNLESQYTSGLLKQKAAELALRSLASQKEMMKAREEQAQNQLSRCFVASPCRGVVLARYRNEGEIASPSSPLFELGASDTVQADFFLPQPFLSGIALGQQLRVRLDQGKKGEFLPARVSWISNTAEFSPKNIQTRESRNGLFFRVRVLADNKEGKLKRGMPVEIWR